MILGCGAGRGTGGNDAVVEAVVELGAAIDGNGAASCEGDGLHQISIGESHLIDFSKGFGMSWRKAE